MNVLVVFTHAESNSFNGALFETSVDAFRNAEHEVKTSDLYSMEYDPVSDRRNFTTVRDAKYFSQQPTRSETMGSHPLSTPRLPRSSGAT